jgi:hypothetical protein
MSRSDEPGHRPGGRPPYDADRDDPRRPGPVERPGGPDRRLAPPPDFEQHDRPRPEQKSGVRVLRPVELPNPTEGPAVVTHPVTPEGAEPPPDADDPVVRSGVLGVNIADGFAYLAVVEPTGTPRLDLADHLVPVDDDDPSVRVGDFAELVTETLQKLPVGTVAMARPLRYSNWTYSSAFERVTLETCFMLAAYQLELRFESVGQHHAANVVGLPLVGLGDSLRAKLHLDRSVDWQNRFPALLVALGIALELHGGNLSEAARDH